MAKKFPVVVIDHIESDDIGALVYCWGEEAGLEALKSCLQRGETVEVRLTTMTEKQYDRLPDYEGDC